MVFLMTDPFAVELGLNKKLIEIQKAHRILPQILLKDGATAGDLAPALSANPTPCSSGVGSDAITNATKE